EDLTKISCVEYTWRPPLGWDGNSPVYRCEKEPMPPDNDIQAVQRLHAAYGKITRELTKMIVGQQQVIEELLVAMFARGHCLLVGVPGLAKTLLIRSLASTLSLKFSRIQ